MMPRCFKYLLTVIFIIFCSSIVLANDTAAHVVNAGSTSTVRIYARSTSATGNNLMGFASYLYYDNQNDSDTTLFFCGREW